MKEIHLNEISCLELVFLVIKLPCEVTSSQHSDGFKCFICFIYLFFSYLITSIWSLKNCHILLCRQTPRGCAELNAPSCQQWLLDAGGHSCDAATRTDQSSPHPPSAPPLQLHSQRTPCLLWKEEQIAAKQFDTEAVRKSKKLDPAQTSELSTAIKKKERKKEN